jgi:four helix bundle protein
MQGFRDRTKQFALRVIRMFVALPKTPLAQTLGRQVLRSGTSVAANVREASRARSKKEFIAKLCLAEQELDESLLWLELLVEGGVVPQAKLASLHQEGEEILRITVATIKTSKRRAAG